MRVRGAVRKREACPSPTLQPPASSLQPLASSLSSSFPFLDTRRARAYDRGISWFLSSSGDLFPRPFKPGVEAWAFSTTPSAT